MINFMGTMMFRKFHEMHCCSVHVFFYYRYHYTLQNYSITVSIATPILHSTVCNLFVLSLKTNQKGEIPLGTQRTGYFKNALRTR